MSGPACRRSTPDANIGHLSRDIADPAASSIAAARFTCRMCFSSDADYTTTALRLTAQNPTQPLAVPAVPVVPSRKHASMCC